jgi:hypothetical protein
MPTSENLLTDDLLTHIALYLSDPWELVPLLEDETYSHWRQLLRYDGAKLYFNTAREKDKLHISCEVQKDSQGKTHLGYKDTLPSINVSAYSKTPKQIAGDIERRLMPEFKVLLDKNAANIANIETELDRKVSMGQALAATFPFLRLHDNISQARLGVLRNGDGWKVSLDTSYEFKPSIDIEISGGKTSLKLDGLSLEETTKVLNTLSEIHDARPREDN